MRTTLVRTTTCLGCLFLVAALPTVSQAVPVLQLYVEGATYNSNTQSWEFVADSQGVVPIRLWAIGNVAGPGGHGPISDVKLAIAFDTEIGELGINILPSSTNGYGGFTDPSPSSAAPLVQYVTDGSLPELSDGRTLPKHGEYGPGTSWKEYLLGDFTRTDSPIADFITTFPTLGSNPPLQGQINAYEITFLKPVGETVHVHFDLYDNIQSGNKAKAKFSPFSHDAHADGVVAPEPSTFVMLAMGLVCACFLIRPRAVADLRHSAA
jgi:hypothetical protein